MSIERELHSTFKLICDICGGELCFDDFSAVAEHMKAKGWEKREDDGGWYDVCPACLRRGFL